MANIGWRTERINAVSDFGLCWLRYRRLAELQNQRRRELLFRRNEGFERRIIIINRDLGHSTRIFLQIFYLHLQF